MKTTKLLLIIVFALMAVVLSAQPILIGFKDASPTTLGLVRLEAPEYPVMPPVAVRFHVEAYLSLDGTIDPITEEGLPTGDDAEFFTLYLNFGPNGNLALNNLSIDPIHAGKYVYLRVFNATTIEAATKYMTFHTPYLIPAPGSTVAPNIRPDLGWAEPTWTPLASTPPTYTLTVNSNYPGAAIHLDGEDTGEVTPFTFDPADAGIYTVVLLNVEWTPPEYVYEAEANAEVYFNGVYGPNAPNVTAPTEGQVFEWTEPGTVDVVWDLDPMVDYYEVKFMEEEWVAVAEGNSTSFDITESGNYYVNVRGVKNDPTLGSKTFTKARFTTRNVSNSPKGTGAVATVNFSVVITAAAEIPEDTPTPVGDATVTISGGSANYDMEGYIPPIPNGSILIADQFVLQLIGAGPWTIRIQTTAPWASYYSGGMWHAVEKSGGFITFTVTASKDMDLPVVLADLDPTLPVELSVFNAVLTAQKFVKLTWVSESETNMLGYRVYRSETNDANSATQITAMMIEATNTSTTQVYSIEDREVLPFSTYYYWLEAVDYNHSNFFGPQFVEVPGEVVPELPVQTAMKNAYPNPFKTNANTNIEVALKAGETGTVTIYNVLGQVVKTYSVNEGSHTLNWNGRDSKGNACGSGIYFYKLSTPSMNQTKKMVIVK